jgi:hypothetical protein
MNISVLSFVARAGICASIAVSGCATTGPSTPEVRVALSGANAIPPNRSTAVGKASFWVHPDRTLSGVLETSGVQGTAAYLSLGGPGKTGPVAVQLVRAGSEGPVEMEQAPISGGSWVVPRSARFSEEHYRAFVAGETHVTVHSPRYPQGEIRGQLKP